MRNCKNANALKRQGHQQPKYNPASNQMDSRTPCFEVTWNIFDCSSKDSTKCSHKVTLSAGQFPSFSPLSRVPKDKDKAKSLVENLRANFGSLQDEALAAFKNAKRGSKVAGTFKGVALDSGEVRRTGGGEERECEGHTSRNAGSPTKQ